jgi:hypothetical protein
MAETTTEYRVTMLDRKGRRVLVTEHPTGNREYVIALVNSIDWRKRPKIEQREVGEWW